MPNENSLQKNLFNERELYAIGEKNITKKMDIICGAYRKLSAGRKSNTMEKYEEKNNNK